LLTERIILTGSVARSWVSPALETVEDGVWLELQADNATLAAYLPRSPFAGSESQWFGLQGHEIRITVHDVSLLPPLTPPLWKIDKLVVRN